MNKKFIRQITATSVTSKHSCSTIEGLKRVSLPISSEEFHSKLSQEEASKLVFQSSKAIKQIYSLFQVELIFLKLFFKFKKLDIK